MQITNRDGSKEDFSRESLTSHLAKYLFGLDQEQINLSQIVDKVYTGVYDGIKTTELNTLVAETTAYLSTHHPDYAVLAARIAVADLHKCTSDSFVETSKILHSYTNPRNGLPAPLLSDKVFAFILEHAERLEATVDYKRDYNYDYFGFKTLEKSYLLKVKGQIVERPQHMLMRVACGIHADDIEAAIETYTLLSEKWFTHASPTLFNAGTPMPQLSSCFLLTMKDDSIDGIYDTLKQCALISKSAGGVGLSVSNIRASGSYIRGTNGVSNGLVPMLRVFNDTARYVDQGGGKRKGAFAVYLEPWHGDIFEFLELKKNHGKEEHRARDLFFGLWIPDLFMRRVEQNGEWSLFCPNEAPGLMDVWGDEFDRLYERYEREGKAIRTVKAQQLWFAILDSQVETGVPFMLFKDSCNRKSNQQNLGTIRSSNLCTEIIEYTSPDEVAVCNLASISLPRFVTPSATAPGTLTFDHQRLYEVTRTITKNLNKIIDLNHYPVPEAARSNFRHRPIGLGVQGLADVFIQLRLPFESDEARRLNRDIFETIYYGAVSESHAIAAALGPYETYPGSPISRGLFQFDLWGMKPESGRWDWESLRAKVVADGVRNSLLIAPMPTASTSQILGNNECFEPYTSNLYTRRVLAGEFPVVNAHLVRDLVRMGLWTPSLRNKIISQNGSIAGIADIPEDIRELYKTVWEIKQRSLVDMAADRGPFIDQSQSFNVFIAEPTTAKLTSLHFYAWKKGLKTGMYYLRSRPAVDAIKFTVDALALKAPSAAALSQQSEEPEVSGPVCRKEAGCISCGS